MFWFTLVKIVDAVCWHYEDRVPTLGVLTEPPWALW